MKHTFFLQAGLLTVLAVLAISCGVPMRAEGGYYEDVPSGRGRDIYIGDPYYRGGNTIIVERDPFTGRYYQAGPGGIYGAPAYRDYSHHYNNRYYNNRNYNGDRSGNHYRTSPQVQQPRQAPAPRTPDRQQREQARDAILGKKRN